MIGMIAGTVITAGVTIEKFAKLLLWKRPISAVKSMLVGSVAPLLASVTGKVNLLPSIDPSAKSLMTAVIISKVGVAELS